MTVEDIPKGKNSFAASLTLSSGNSLQPGDLVVATASDANGNTSEFSAEVEVIGNCTLQTWYVDADNDSFGIDSETNISSCTKPEGNYVTQSGDCNDNDPDINPEAVEVPDDGIDQDFSGSDLVTIAPDTDNDGFADDVDNCPTTANFDQKDSDLDGVGDVGETECLGSDTFGISECTGNSSVIWTLNNPGSCAVDVRWEVRKGDSGSLTLAAGSTGTFETAIASKGQTQVTFYWNNSQGVETKTTVNASGTGCNTMSATTEQNEEVAEFDVSEPVAAPVVYPNPIAEDGFYISFSAEQGGQNFDARIFDLGGRLLANRSIQVTSQGGEIYWNLDHDSWEAGVYILHLSNDYQVELMKN